MARMSKVELYAAIRREAQQGASSRTLELKYRIGRRTVQAALRSAWPQPRKPLPPRFSKLDPFKPLVDDILRADLTAPRKQRHTVVRIFERLITEQQMQDVSYQVLRAYVARRRPEIRAAAGQAPQVFIRQTHLPGAEAEVDFGEVVINLRGDLTSCTLFVLRMSFSGKAVHRVSATAGLEAFLEGHVHAFNVLGGIPAGKVRYDNLKAAVAQVIGLTRRRAETERWTAFRSHFGIDPFYCQPGIDGAHEKGGVEGQVGWFRRNHLVPVPRVESFDQLNTMIDAWDAADDARRIGTRPFTIGEQFAIERPLLTPLPADRFETGLWLSPQVDRYSQINVRTNRYSVPVRLIGRRVRVQLHASHLVVYDNRTEAARHERMTTKGGSRLDLDHYLEALVRKPGALPGATALEQARAAGRFTPVHDAWWQAVCRTHGDKAGAHALIEVLLLHRHMAHEHVVAGLAAALQVGALTADAVALQARKNADGDEHPARTSQPLPANVISLSQHRLTHLPPDRRPPPSVTVYDQLLRRHARRPAEGHQP